MRYGGLSAPPINGGGGEGEVNGATIPTPWGPLGTPGGSPPGVADFPQLARDAISAANGESGAKKELLQKAGAIALSAAPIPVAGWVVALGSALIGTILSNLNIRGRTQHLSVIQGQDQAEKWITTTVAPVWNSLPVEGRKRMYQLVANWTDGMWRTYSGEWGGVIARDLGQWFPWGEKDPTHVQGGWAFLDLGNPGPVWQEIHNAAFGFLWRILVLSDAETLNDIAFRDFSGFYNTDVLLPLNDFMVAKYNTTLDQYRAVGGTAPVQTAGDNSGLLVAGGLGLLALVAGGSK